MNETIAQYLEFLWTQFQYDWSVFTNPWVLYPIVPAVVYLLFFLLKWWVLLAPITVPITTYTHGMSKVNTQKDDNTDKLKEELNKLFKR